MSRFFATGSDSESEESSSTDEITPKAPGGNFKQSVQFTIIPIIRTQIPLFVVISLIHIVLPGRCFSVMMRRTLREWCAAPRTKGWCGLFFTQYIFKTVQIVWSVLVWNAFILKSKVWGVDQPHQDYPQCYEDSRHGQMSGGVWAVMSSVPQKQEYSGQRGCPPFLYPSSGRPGGLPEPG